MNPLRQTIQQFDRMLCRRFLQRLSLSGLQRALDDIDRFRLQADRYRLSSAQEEGLQEESLADGRLIAAGCLLSSDLNEAVIARLVDTVQDEDQAIARLSTALRERLQMRYQAVRMLNKAQRLQQHIRHASDMAGLM